MARSTGRTRPCTKATTDGRRAKAIEFWEAACDLDALHPTDKADACIQLCILAGIAAADVICCVHLGEHADDQAHNTALVLLRKIDAKLAGHLSILLRQKTASGYRERSSSPANRLLAKRSAEALVEAAKTAR